MVSIASNGNYTVTPFYYLIKHFSKNIDAGYKRVDVASSVPNLNISAFTNVAQTKVTVIVINNTASTAKLKLDVTGKTISNITVDQSKETDLYKRLEGIGSS